MSEHSNIYVGGAWIASEGSDQIDVVVHPQSVVHSLVEYLDGSVIAQLSPPDMRLPIQYALTWPDRWQGPAKKLDLTQASAHFTESRSERRPFLPLEPG